MQLNTVKFIIFQTIQILHIDKSPRKIQKQVNLDLKSLYKWLLANKILLNCSKPELIFFTHHMDQFLILA